MREVIVYGLGYVWSKDKDLINQTYSIVGYSDRDEKNAELFDGFIPLNRLKETVADVLICATWKFWPYMIQSLTQDFGVDENRIIVWENEQDIMKMADIPDGGFISYAQFGEDYVISEILKKRKISLDQATYLELGVWNPIRSNNTIFLHRAGAKGLLVDANPDYIPAIRLMRKGSVVLHRALVGSEDRQAIMTFYIERNGGTSSLDRASIEAYQDSEIVKTVSVETITINECMDYLGRSCKVLSVDLEGYDKAVLKDLDYERFAPEIICAETRGDQNMYRYMKDKGYRFVFGNGVNDIWERV